MLSKLPLPDSVRDVLNNANDMPRSIFKRLRGLMLEAYLIAQNSTDPNTQNGALLASSYADGVYDPLFGGFTGQADFPETSDRVLPFTNEDKHLYLTHAERAVLFRAASQGFPTRGEVMICPWATCMNCANAIVGCGISEVVVHGDLLDLYEKWHSEVVLGLEYLKRFGVIITVLNGPLGKGRFDTLMDISNDYYDIRFMGGRWNPVKAEWSDTTLEFERD